MRVVVVQTSPRLGDVAGNLERAKSLVLGSDVKRADLVVFPELFATGYCLPDAVAARDLAETVPGGKTTAALEEVARALGATAVVGGVCEREKAEPHGEARLFNAAAVVTAGGWLTTYRKAHLFFEEKLLFAPGPRRPPVLEMKGGFRLGVMICYDWRFPEVARGLAVEGADVVAHPSNLVVRSSGPDTLAVRAADNRIFWAMADRVGEDPRSGREPLEFLGRSQVVDPVGTRLVELLEPKEAVGVAEIDPQRARAKVLAAGGREGVVADLLADRRRDLYPLFGPPSGAGRLVVQRHELPDGTHHFDLMLEWGDVLRTWSYEAMPRAGVDAKRIFDHRRTYLEFEGPIDGGARGSVRIVARGEYEVVLDAPDRVVFDARGDVVGRFDLRK